MKLRINRVRINRSRPVSVTVETSQRDMISVKKTTSDIQFMTVFINFFSTDEIIRTSAPTCNLLQWWISGAHGEALVKPM